MPLSGKKIPTSNPKQGVGEVDRYSPEANRKR
jgi:hypothetical protein